MALLCRSLVSRTAIGLAILWLLVLEARLQADVMIDNWRAVVAEYPIPEPPTSTTKIYPTSTPAEIQNMINNATNGAAFLLMASAPDTPSTYRRWSVTAKPNQKFYGELHSDGRTRLVTLKGSKDLSPGVVSWAQNANGIWYCTETGALGGNAQADRYPAGYKRNAYGRTVVLDGTTPLNHLWPPSSIQGQLVSLEIFNAGSGYTPGTHTGISISPVTGSNGTGATATVVVGSDGKVASVTLSAGGQGYDGKNVTGTLPGGGSGWQCQVDDFVRALTASSAGAFCLDDPANTLYLGFDPAGHTVEIMTDIDCFAPVSGVEIYNLKVQHYANQIQDVPVEMGDDGRVEYVEISQNHAGAVRAKQRCVIRNCLITRNLQIGYKGPGAHNTLVEGNEISFNNTELGPGNFITSWESGGGKMSGSRNVTFRNNYLHDNGGPGIWFDIENGRPTGTDPVIMEGNICENNTTSGIFHEISYSGIIRGNYCRDNGTQILVAESGPVQVYGNVAEITAAKKDGIKFRQGNRSNDAGTVFYYCNNNPIHHNRIIHRIDTGQEESGGSTSVAHYKTPFYDQLPPFGGNWFDGNTYHVPSLDGDYWTWWDNRATLAEFRSYGHEGNATIVGDGAVYTDTSPPSTPPAPTVTRTAVAPLTLRGATEMAVMIRVYEGTRLLATTFTDETGKWSTPIDGLSPSLHYLHVTATDAAKNTSTPSPTVAVWNEAPWLDQTAMVNGTFSFVVNGPDGPDYTIQVSTDLSKWTNLDTLDSPGTPFPWSDANSTAHARRFYRVSFGP